MAPREPRSTPSRLRASTAQCKEDAQSLRVEGLRVVRSGQVLQRADDAAAATVGFEQCLSFKARITAATGQIGNRPHRRGKQPPFPFLAPSLKRLAPPAGSHPPA